MHISCSFEFSKNKTSTVDNPQVYVERTFVVHIASGFRSVKSISYPKASVMQMIFMWLMDGYAVFARHHTLVRKTLSGCLKAMLAILVLTTNLLLTSTNQGSTIAFQPTFNSSLSCNTKKKDYWSWWWVWKPSVCFLLCSWTHIYNVYKIFLLQPAI